VIRPARPEDVKAVYQLVQDAYGHYVARLGKPPGPMLDDYAQRIMDGQLWVLDEAGALAGLVVLENGQDGTLLLHNVAVAPSAQGKGYGWRLVAFAEAEARLRGRSKVRLYTHVLMTENLAFYEWLGFCETSRVSEKGYERVYMAKTLA
jgi:ribosomal protein S18 acetylase RimI-like enzyme